MALPMLFLPMPATPPPILSVIVRATDVSGARQAIRAAVASADSSVPIVRMETLDERVSRLFKGFRAVVDRGGDWRHLDRTGGRGPALAAFITVRRRRREIAIRVALGARTNEIVWLVTAPMVWLVTAGAVRALATAIPIAALLGRRSSARYRSTRGACCQSVAILLCVALISALGPMYHATRVDPIQCLRDE